MRQQIPLTEKENEYCVICGLHIDEVGILLDDVCRLCNNDSHEWADQELEQELWSK